MLKKLLYEEKLLSVKPCSLEEKNKFLDMMSKKEKLPNNVIAIHNSENNNIDFFITNKEIDYDETDLILKLKMYQELKGINGTLTFFKVLSILTIIASVGISIFIMAFI